MLNCFINIDKPEGLTSAQVVGRVKWLLKPLFGKVKIGHTGTLDPFATGVLPIAIGEATKTVQFQMNGVKEYEFRLDFSHSTNTYDKDGEIMECSRGVPSESDIQAIIPNFVGEILETPPQFSAIKIDGVRAYKLAREGVDFEIPPRINTIYNLELIGKKTETSFDFKVSGAKGFYVRSLGVDIAKSLGLVAHISVLRRIKNGAFNAENAISLDKLQEILQNVPKSLDVRDCDLDFALPLSYGLNDILVIDITKEEADKLKNGIIKPVDSFEDISEDTLYQVHYNSQPMAVIKKIDQELEIVRGFNW